MRGRGLHRFAVFMVLATLFLVFAGAMVTSTGSGLAVPDWPRSYGMWMPPMVGGIFYEHGHRMVAAGVATVTLLVATALAIFETRRWVKVLGFVAFGMVIVQAVLGGLTVLNLLPPPISIAHACLAQAIVCVMVSVAIVTSPAWREAVPAAGASLSPRPFVALTFAVYVQLIVGATMRHLGAGLAIPDFPTSMGGALPPMEALSTAPVAIHFVHRLGAVVIVLLAAPCLLAASRSWSERPDLRLPAVVLCLALPTQIVFGAFVIWTKKELPVLTSLHVANGALVLATCMALTLLVYRRSPAASREVAPTLLATAGRA